MKDPNAWLFKFILHKFQLYSSGLKVLASSSNITFYIDSFLGIILSLYLLRKFLNIKSFIKENSILLEITPPASVDKTAYTTSKLFSVIHDLGERRTLREKIIGKKILFSFEIVSTKQEGIRYLIRTTPDEVNNVKRNVISYLPQVGVKTVNEYLPPEKSLKTYQTKIIEFKLRKHFAYPLQRLDELKEHDPVAYITGMMTKLSPGELISFQMVLSPTQSRTANIIQNKILNSENTLGYLNKFDIPLLMPLMWLIKLITYILGLAVYVVADIASSSKTKTYQPTVKKQRVLNAFEKETVDSVQNKISQPLFETTIRLLVIVKDKKELNERVNGFISSLGTFSVPKYQGLKVKSNFFPALINKVRMFNYRKRLLSMFSNKSSNLLSVSEVSDLYHFPFLRVTQTENIVKAHSKELAAPLSLKNGSKLDVIFARNTYGGTETPIGLNEEERRRHMYILGATGTGKSTLLLSMVYQDIMNNKGLAVIDPHGDLIEKVLPLISENRLKDVIYFNPDDIGFPIGLNLLELTPDLSDDDSLREKEFITESIISLFHKLYPEKYSGPRMEYILRNTIHTAFTTSNPTIFTIYKLLTNPKFRKGITNALTDENLKDFWKYEFNKAGDYQKVKMISPITNKIGRFLFSPTAKRILEQEKSGINFDEIMDDGKILLCNLSKGKVGEDTSEVFGILIMTKIQLAALKRARVDISKRKDFYLYVDEFQNFATPSFAQILSEARKYRLNAILAHQTTSQLEDKDLVNVTLANTGTIICFRTANPEDEKLILPQFIHYVNQGEIANLPSFRFYIKINAITPEEPFSGETTPVDVPPDKNKVDEIINISRKNYATKLAEKKVKIKEDKTPIQILLDDNQNPNILPQYK